MKRKEPASPTVTSDDPDSESPNKKKKKHNDFNGWWKLDLETSDTMVSQNKTNNLKNTQQICQALVRARVAQPPPRTPPMVHRVHQTH